MLIMFNMHEVGFVVDCVRHSQWSMRCWNALGWTLLLHLTSSFPLPFSPFFFSPDKSTTVLGNGGNNGARGAGPIAVQLVGVGRRHRPLIRGALPKGERRLVRRRCPQAPGEHRRTESQQESTAADSSELLIVAAPR